MKVTAHVQRSGDWWAVDVPEVPGVFTQAKRLDQVPAQVADAVATMLEIPVDSVDVDLAPALPDEAAAAVAEAIEKSRAATVAAEEASRAMRNAVAHLRTAEHLTVRDTAKVLGVSHQRVSQLEAAR